MVCYLGNTFCYAIQGEMKNESKPARPGRTPPTMISPPSNLALDLDLALRSLSHPRPGVNRTYLELLKVINFFRAPLYGIQIQVTNEHTS